MAAVRVNARQDRPVQPEHVHVVSQYRWVMVRVRILKNLARSKSTSLPNSLVLPNQQLCGNSGTAAAVIGLETLAFLLPLWLMVLTK